MWDRGSHVSVCDVGQGSHVSVYDVEGGLRSLRSVSHIDRSDPKSLTRPTRDGGAKTFFLICIVCLLDSNSICLSEWENAPLNFDSRDFR